NRRIRSHAFEFRTKNPTIELLTAIIPINEVNTAVTSFTGVTSTSTKMGSHIKIYGTINAAIASFTAFITVLNGFARAITAPAYAAKLTGGVMSATIPK